LYSRIWHNIDFSWSQYLVCITTDAGRHMDHCVPSAYNFIIENNHSLIYNMTADQHNMFTIRPWKEVPQTVDLGASPSLPVVFFSSLLWLHKPAQSTCHYCSLWLLAFMQTAWLHSWHGVQGSRLEGEALHLEGDMKEAGLWGLLLWPEMKSCHLLCPSCNN